MEKEFILCKGADVCSYIIYVNFSLQRAIIAAKFFNASNYFYGLNRNLKNVGG
jgi:hypothetical protein